MGVERVLRSFFASVSCIFFGITLCAGQGSIAASQPTDRDAAASTARQSISDPAQSTTNPSQSTNPAQSTTEPTQSAPNSQNPTPDSSPQTPDPNSKPSTPGQTTTPAGGPASAPASSEATRAKTEEEIEKEKLEQSYRVMGVVPMFGTTSRKNATPLTKGEKFRIFYKSAFDPVTFVVVGFQAGISQWEDEFPDYGEGIGGYGKYYGAAFADSVDSNFFSNFFYPVLFKQDPRYFRLGEGSIKHRIWYSLQQEWIAHKDTGGRTFHFSNVLGAFTSGSISNAYYPESDRGFELTMSRSAIALGYGTIGGIFSEFWPDIQAKIFKNHKDRRGLSLPSDDASPPPQQK